MKVSKREFYWACSMLIPQILEAKKMGVVFNVPDMVNSFSHAYMANRLIIPASRCWIINLAADTVSIIANELNTNACFSFADEDCHCWGVLSNKEQSSFMEKYGELL